VRVSGGVFNPPAGILPENILKILGISGIVLAASLGLNGYKYGAAYAVYRALIRCVPLAAAPIQSKLQPRILNKRR
jgi:hypothetical protein